MYALKSYNYDDFDFCLGVVCDVHCVYCLLFYNVYTSGICYFVVDSNRSNTVYVCIKSSATINYSVDFPEYCKRIFIRRPQLFFFLLKETQIILFCLFSKLLIKYYTFSNNSNNFKSTDI